MGGGSSSQSIFMRNEKVDQGLAGPEMFYRNIAIVNNVIANRHQHGITVGQADGVLIDRNTVIQKAGPRGDKEVPLPTIKVVKDAVNVTITNNIAARFSLAEAAEQPGWKVANNLVVESLNAGDPNFVGKVLANAQKPATAVRADFMVAVDNKAKSRGIGAVLDAVKLPVAALQP
jgi:Right handed beta helix region